MIEERIEAGRKNIEWSRKRFIKRTDIEIQRISKVSPVKDKEGRYCFHVLYKRVTTRKQNNKNIRRNIIHV